VSQRFYIPLNDFFSENTLKNEYAEKDKETIAFSSPFFAQGQFHFFG